MEPINARIETVESKPMFRDAFQTRRCIVPANGWYEWKTTPRGKVPFYHQSFDESVLSIMGYTNTGSVRTALCILSAY